MAGYTVVFDSTSMQSTTPGIGITSEKIQYRGIPKKTIGVEVLAHANKSSIPYIDYPGRTIIISGTIKGSSPADLDARIDAMKLALAGTDKNLDIGNGTNVRRFIATLEALEFPTDLGQVSTADFEAQFTTTNPFGLDTSATTFINDTNQSSVTYTASGTFAGTAPVQRPVITYTLLDAVTSTTNLVGNPDFEVNTTNWFSLYSATLTRVTAQFHAGVASLQVVNAASATSGFYGGAEYFVSGLTIGQSYTLYVWMKGNAGGESITYGVPGRTGTVALTTSWQRVAITFTAISTTGDIQLACSNAASGTWFVDDVSMQLMGTGTILIGNNATGQQLTITKKFNVNDVIVIDTLNKIITVNGAEIAPVGGFPEFKPGAAVFGYSDSFLSRLFNFNVTYVAAYL